MSQTERQTPRVVDLQGRETVYRGHFKLDRLELRHEKFSGEMSSPLVREALRTGRAVAVLLYDPQADAVVMIEQFRIGALLNGVAPPWILECVAGMVDAGEVPEAAARREVEEETGCTVGQMERMGSFLSSPGTTDEQVTLFAGQVDAALAGGVHGEAAESEDIRTLVLTREQALAAADSGAVANMVAQVALLWLARHGEALRARWLAAAAPTQS